MNKDTSDVRLKTFSNIVVEELKILAAEGKKLSPDVLVSKLSERQEMSGLMESQGTSDESLETYVSGPADGTDKLKSQIGNIWAQRDRLLKQLGELEEQSTKETDFYKRVFLLFIELIRTEENKSIHESLDEFKKEVKDRADVDRLENVFQRIKDIMLREDSPKQGGETSLYTKCLKFFHTDQQTKQVEETTLDQLRETYAEIIDELKLNLDEDSLKKLSKIEERIYRVNHLDKFPLVRKDITLLVQDYIIRISEEREEAAAFIREIGERLIEVEGHILKSIPYARENLQETSDFNTLLQQQLQELRENVDFSNTLAQLKQSVVSSLTTIQKAIEEKRENDTARMAEGEKKMGILQQDLQNMKKEIITARERAQTLEQELLMDPLTGVYNRRAYDKRINEEFRRFLRHRHPFSVLLLDVDHFKRINDKYGHAVGDICLKEIINRIRPVLRESDFLARFGGEEFIALLPETGRKGAEGVAEKLRQGIEKTEFLHKEESVQITISIGVTQVDANDTSTQILFSRVDMAMYRAKQEGRNRVVVS